MAFLQGLALSVIEWVLTNFAQMGIKWAQDHMAQKQAQAQANADASLLKEAKTDDDKTLAARKIADDTF